MRNKAIPSLIWFVFIFSLFSTTIKAYGQEEEIHKYNLKTTQDHFSKILLVIYYNHPYFNTIDYLKQLYSPIFKNIVIYGDRTQTVDTGEADHINEDGKHGDIHIVYTRSGYYYTKLMENVLENFPDYEGYIFLQDDCMMQFWKLLQLDKEKIWYGGDGLLDRNSELCIKLEKEKKSQCGDSLMDENPETYNRAGYRYYLCHKDEPHPQNWFNTTAGLPEVIKILPYLTVSEKENLDNSFGKDRFAWYPCDFFYLPGHFSKQASKLCKMFPKVFCEISIPTLLGCLDPMQNWEQLFHFWRGHDNNQISSNYHPEMFFIHPLKYSMQFNRDFTLSVFQKYFYNNLENGEMNE